MTHGADLPGFSNPPTCTVDDLILLVESGKRFGCIYADPPWLYNNQATRAATSNHYPGMTLEEICSLPVRPLVADDAHLYLWVTNAFLFDGLNISEAWGFEFRSTSVWLKPNMGLGNYWRSAHETILICTRVNANIHSDSPDAVLLPRQNTRSGL
jgi:N6-adenosine-specific RNA methylase IME4